MTRVAVVGHVEWVDFVAVERYPRRGEVLHAGSWWSRAAGGGGVAAGVLAAQPGVEVDFFTALGRDAEGQAAAAQLAERGVRMHVAWRDREPTRRAVTLLESERTIVTMGERLEPRGADELPWELLRDAEGVYLTAGDDEAVGRGREAGALVATPRAWRPGQRSPVRVDALVFSAADPAEAPLAAALSDQAGVLIATEGAAGGHWSGASEGHWQPVPAPGEPQDSYGCGDSFAAGVTLGLARGLGVEGAVALGVELGARAVTCRGAP